MPSYDIAISFAGEDRVIAEKIASSIHSQGYKIFYDEYEQSELWGKDLYTYLSTIYKDEAKYCLMLLSENYAKKRWTSHERRAAQARAFMENSEYILPLRLDDTEIEGIHHTVGYLDFRTTSIEKIVEFIIHKIHAYNKKHGITYELVKVEDVFARAPLHTGKTPIKDANFQTTCPACNTEQNLSEATLSQDDDETIYTCKNGCQTIVVVSRPGVEAWQGSGYRFGAYAIKNPRDLMLKNEDLELPIRINAGPACLMKKRPKKSGDH